MILGANPMTAFHLDEGRRRLVGRKTQRAEGQAAGLAGEGQWLGVGEVARTLAVAVVTVRRWIKSGRLTAHWVGDQYRVHRSAVTAAMRPAGPQLGARRAGRQVAKKRRIGGKR